MERIVGVICLILVFAFSLPAAASQDGPHVHSEGPNNEVFKVGTNGDVKIGQNVKIGDVLVKKGKYLLTHRAEGDRHILVLTGIDTKNSAEAPVHEIRTRFIPQRNQ